jgi:hypothetical protein
MHELQDISKDSCKDVIVTVMLQGTICICESGAARSPDTSYFKVTYRVVSLCSTWIASMTVVVYSIPVVRLVPLL